MNVTINADDFGLNEKRTGAIIEAFEKSLIDTTTFIVTTAYFDEAVRLAYQHNLKDKIGFHLNIVEGAPMTDPIKNESYFCKNGLFHHHLKNKILTKKEKTALEIEIDAQIRKYQSAGLSIHHFDSHQGVHLRMGILPVVVKKCKEYEINKIRIRTAFEDWNVVQKILTRATNGYLKSKHLNYTDAMGRFQQILERMPDEYTEIMCHPDYDDNGKILDRARVTTNLEEQVKTLREKSICAK